MNETDDLEFCVRCEQEFPVQELSHDEEGNWLCAPCLTAFEARRLERFRERQANKSKPGSTPRTTLR